MDVGVSLAMSGRVDENGKCPRGEMSPEMSALFDGKHAGCSLVREPDGGSRWSVFERTGGEFQEAVKLSGAGPLAGHSLRANVIR